MNKAAKLFILLCILSISLNAQNISYVATPIQQDAREEPKWVWQTEQFADVAILRYKVEGWDKLTLNQKLLVYYLTQAGLAGRDINYAQNYKYNIAIRKSLEYIITNYKGERTDKEWMLFMNYAKRVWFSNGIHHHYATDKMMPDCSEAYFRMLLKETGYQLDEKIIAAMFNPAIDMKQVSLDAKSDMLLNSAINFYGDEITQADAEKFYAAMKNPADTTPVSWGLNSRLVKTPAGIVEDVYKLDGLYGEAIKQIMYWLNLAAGVAENKAQADALYILIDYYKTGDLEKWDEYNLAWLKATDGDIDYIQGFVEVYKDPLNMHGSYESIVEIKDFEASQRMASLSSHAQWFEDHSPIMDEHKKDSVVGITYKVVNVASESGDASPSTAIGVNLPNADWIRADFGSKSVSLGNIVQAYEMAGGPGITNEFCFTAEEKDRAAKYGSLAAKMHTAMHEVIGHASGEINENVGSPKETLKSYGSPIEEARADLVALYYIMDPQLVEWGLIPTTDVGKAQYEGYIRNGLMTQLRRLEPGKTIEESHMRNRQMIAAWVYEKGKAKNVIEKKFVDGKTYFVINDYEALRKLFGELLREVQRIKSEGDYDAAQMLIETYGVQVDPQLHAEVLKRSAPLNLPPYFGFINPQYELVKDASGTVIDVAISYPDDFVTQMLYYGKNYSFLTE